MTLSLVFQIPQFPLEIWLVMAILSLASWYLLLSDREAFGSVDVRRRFVGAAILVLLFCVPLRADVIIYMPCDWEDILRTCGGDEWCAWAVWWVNGCPFRVG